MHVYVFYLMDAYNNLSSCLCSLYSICIFKHKNIENPPVRKWYLVLSANKAILYIPWLVTKIEAQHYFTKRLKCISTQKGADPAMSSFPLSEIKDSWFEQLQLQCKLPLLLAALGFHKCTWPHPMDNAPLDIAHGLWACRTGPKLIKVPLEARHWLPASEYIQNKTHPFYMRLFSELC